MDASRLASMIVGGVVSFLYIILSIVFILYTAKHKKLTAAFFATSLVLSTIITVISPYALKPASNTADTLWNASLQGVENLIKSISLERGSEVEKDTSEIPTDTLEIGMTDIGQVLSAQQEKNRLLYHSALPLANRALVPDSSLYPNITMESVSLYESAGPGPGGYQGATRSSESVTYAFTAPISKPAALFEELEEEILKNPLVGYMIVLGLQDAYSGFEWETSLKGFADACATAYALPPGGDVRGVAGWYAGYLFPDGKSAIYVTDAYRIYAEALCQFLETFTNYGVQDVKSERYLSRNPGVGYENAGINIVETELELPALVLYRKGDDGQDACAIGFDLNDKGMLVYDPSVIQQ